MRVTEEARLLGKIEAQNELIIGKISDLEKRVRDLEKKQWLWSGGLLIIGLFWTVFSKSISVALGYQ